MGNFWFWSCCSHRTIQDSPVVTRSNLSKLVITDTLQLVFQGKKSGVFHDLKKCFQSLQWTQWTLLVTLLVKSGNIFDHMGWIWKLLWTKENGKTIISNYLIAHKLCQTLTCYSKSNSFIATLSLSSFYMAFHVIQINNSSNFICSGQFLYQALVVKYLFPVSTTRLSGIVDRAYRRPNYNGDHLAVQLWWCQWSVNV